LLVVEQPLSLGHLLAALELAGLVPVHWDLSGRSRRQPSKALNEELAEVILDSRNSFR